LIAPAIEGEIRNLLTDKAEAQALTVFSRNLKSLLLSPPLKGKVVLGFDPAYRTGCKLAVVDPGGNLLEDAVCYPTPPQNKAIEAKEQILGLIGRHRVDVIALGNGTASRESELFLAAAIKDADRPLSYAIVSEAGASIYSASKLGREEFPDLDVSIRGAVSIARRLQDPLAELVKIDPKSLGVGQYQHDVNQKRLAEKLVEVVEDCVNSVGVDVNTASPALLSYVSGISAAVANNIVQYRQDNKGIKTRAELLEIPGLGPKTFEQCAGFLRITDSSNILDHTAVHPDNYQDAGKILNLYPLSKLKHKHFPASEINALAQRLQIGVPTLEDIIHELKKPGRDPRDQLPAPFLRADVLELKDLKPGMILWGTVRNITDFGAFIDIGVHDDGLAHISELSPHFIHSPFDVVSVGEVVKVRILSVEPKRNRISLSLKET
ncbi:MAG TPA: helix-hairpin-helix domain-containing protein, partial [bacterium]|nr:helix-hairpin-helix domain-containing protein [bacterium]